MTIGALVLTLRLHGCFSLKEKRMRIKPILERTRHKFHVSAAEVDYQDVYEMAQLAFVTVNANDRIANSTCDKILDFVESLGLAEISGQHLELIRL
ncbi:MAG TPA: DUF503 domain-containing protein [bacterium]|nr:DUF503 domain-containing protein [bacterium]